MNLNETNNKLFEINGISVYNIKSQRFKTNTINIFFQDNLNHESVAYNALFPSVLRRGSESFPDLKSINLHLEELYGAIFDCGIVKKGERQIIHFYFEYIADKYSFDNSNNFKSGVNFLLDVIYHPALENGHFVTQYVEQEKNNLKMLIESRTNDKLNYALERCYEVMCEGEPFGLYEYGTTTQIDAINTQALYEHYQKAVSTLPAIVFITGEINEQDMNYLKDRLSMVKRGAIKGLLQSVVKKYVKDVQYFDEKMDVNQAKLSLGFRTHVTPKENDYYALMVYNGILGGGMHSKLFQNVREKAGLAYYIFAGLEKFKGLMIIGSGIDIKNKQVAMDIIMKQLESIKNGDISQYEFDSTLKSLETGVHSLKDSQLQVVDFYLSQIISDTHDTLEGLLQKLKRVTKKDVVEVAKKLQLDTVYFLTAKS